VVDILAAGRRGAGPAGCPPAVIYTAENHNHAAEILAERLRQAGGAAPDCECLNTVIGKMSGVVTDPQQMHEQSLAPIAPGLDRAFLVEAFSRILISRIRLPGFRRGIAVFDEKPDLLPFEEAKLYGHNATHALLGYLLRWRGRTFMAEARDEGALLALAREAFLEESGAALCRKFAGVDPLFTADGYRAYVEDLMERMLNPHLRDRVERVTRDPRRKLGWNDRLIGTMRVALSQGIEPRRYAQGAAAALRVLEAEEGKPAPQLLADLWRDVDADPIEKARMADRLVARRP